MRIRAGLHAVWGRPDPPRDTLSAILVPRRPRPRPGPPAGGGAGGGAGGEGGGEGGGGGGGAGPLVVTGAGRLATRCGSGTGAARAARLAFSRSQSLSRFLSL